MVHRGPFLPVRVPPVAFPAPGGNAGALLLEPVRVPRRQRALAGMAELADHVGGAAFVFDVQVHALSRCSLLYFAMRGFSSRSGSPRKRHHLVFGMRSAGRWFVLLVVRLAEHEGLADASAGAGEFDEASVVDDAVDDRGGEFVVGEDRPPFAELDVRGEDDAATFVAAGDDLVEETGPVDVEGHVAELVEDDQVGTGEVPEQAVEGAVAFGLAELEHELRGLPEPHAPALLDGEHAQGGGQVGLSASRLAVEHEVLRLGREIEAGQLLLGVSVGQAHVREVVAVEAFGHREPGLAHEPCPFGGLPVGQFRGEHAVDGVQLAGRGPFERFVDGGLRDEQAPRPLAQRAGAGPSVLLVHSSSLV